MKFNQGLIMLFLLILILPQGSAAFNWVHPENNEIISSPSVYLNLSGTAQDCLFNYNGINNQTINCNGLTMIRLPPVDGVYNLTVTETFPGSQVTTHTITLKIPSGLIITSYSLLFVGLIFCLVFLFLYAFGRLVTLDFDLLDLCLNIGIYFALLMFQAMNLQYLGSEFINDWMLFIINIAIYTNVILPIIAILIVMIWGTFLRMKYPNLFARMPGAGNLPTDASIGQFAKGA